MNKIFIKELLDTIAFQLTKNLVRFTPTKDETLILFLTTPWGQIELEELNLPSNYKLTKDKWRLREAAAVVFHIPTFNRLHKIKKQPGQLWVAWSMECDVNYPQLRDSDFMQQFDLTMTYHLNSDVPTSYFGYYQNSGLKELLKTEPIEKVSRNIASMFISSKFDQSGRLAYARDLMRYFDLHSYGKQLNNRTLKNDHGRQAKRDLMATYKFTLAFENAIAQDYVTEKFYDPLIVGSVPIYMGAPNIDIYAPAEHCFINVADYKNPKELGEHILELNENEPLYQKYLAWKNKPLRASFLKLVDKQKVPVFERLCQKVQEVRKFKSVEEQKSELARTIQDEKRK